MSLWLSFTYPVVILAMHHYFSHLKGSEVTETKLYKLAPVRRVSWPPSLKAYDHSLTVCEVCQRQQGSLEMGLIYPGYIVSNIFTMYGVEPTAA
jgi:hypothetical protein